MPTYVYILIPLAVLVVGLLWKLRQAGQGEAPGDAPAAPPRATGLAGVHQLLDEGQKLAAIQLFMKTTGLGLAEAKEAVELMAKGKQAADAGNVRPSTAAVEADAELGELIGKGNLIGAIKRYRDLTGLGLKESKEAVERLAGRQ